jgi:hypothetical protein
VQRTLAVRVSEIESSRASWVYRFRELSFLHIRDRLARRVSSPPPLRYLKNRVFEDCESRYSYTGCLEDTQGRYLLPDSSRTVRESLLLRASPYQIPSEMEMQRHSDLIIIAVTPHRSRSRFRTSESAPLNSCLRLAVSMETRNK